MFSKNAPFAFDSPFRNRFFTGREELCASVSDQLTQGGNVLLSAPPGRGKTWLAQAVWRRIAKNQAESADVSPIARAEINLFPVQTVPDFLGLFAENLLEAAAPAKEERAQLAHKFLPGLSRASAIKADLNSTAAFDPEQLAQFPDNVLNLPERLAEETGCRFVVVLDDFHLIQSLDKTSGFERRLRAVWQNHKQVSYLMCGSGGPDFAAGFKRPARPFYRFAEVMEPAPISSEAWLPYLSERFKATGKKADKTVLEQLSVICEGEPRLVQELAWHLWQETGNKPAGKKELRSALNIYFALHHRAYSRLAGGLSITQLNLLKAIAMGEEQLSSQPVLDRFRLGSPASTTKNRRLLLAADLLTLPGGQLSFADPLFGYWLKMQYFGAGIRELA